MPVSLLRLDRAEFFDRKFDYRPGEHVSAIMPTQKGKTHMLWQGLAAAARQNPQLTPVTLMPKSRSPATHRWAAALGFAETPTWPPPGRMPWKDKPAGYVVWPRHRLDLPVSQRRQQVAEELRKAMNALYVRGECMVFADDLHVLAVLMGLNPECEEYWTAGAEGHAGLWGANQKPSGTLGSGSVSSFSYNAPSHLFLGRDTDERNVRRFSEIGGVDPQLVAAIVRELRLYQVGGNTISEQLYIDKRGPYMALIGP